MKKLIVLARFKIQLGKEKEALSELTKLLEATRKEEGCIQYDLHVLQNSPQEFMFYEVWTGLEALEKHRNTKHILDFRACRDEFLAEAPNVTLWDEII